METRCPKREPELVDGSKLDGAHEPGFFRRPALWFLDCLPHLRLAEVTADVERSRRERSSEHHSHHPEEAPEADCHDQDDEGVQTQRRAGRDRLDELATYQPYLPKRSAASPIDQPVTLPARQAYSHSASLGSRYTRPD